MNIREKMKPAFAATQGGLFVKVAKADVGGGISELAKKGIEMMAWADPFFPDPSMPKHIEDALVEAVRSSEAVHYTQPIGNQELKAVLAQKLKKFNNLDVNPDRNILITSGSDCGLYYSMLPFVDNGTDVMVLDPSYPNNFQNVALMGGNVIHIPLKKENKFHPDIKDFEERITPNTRLIVLTNPNNPTTTVLRKGFLFELAEFVKKHDLVVVVDQAFEDAVYDNIEYTTFASIPGMFERTVTVFSLSKGMGLSGLRIGYIVAPDQVMDVMYGAAVTVLGATNTAAQKAAIIALQNDEFLRTYNAIFEKRRRMVYKTFSKVPGISLQLPESGFCCWIDVSRLGTGAEIASYLMTNMVAVVNDGATYGSEGKGYIRIIHGVYADDEQLQRAVDRIAKALAELATEKGIVK